MILVIETLEGIVNYINLDCVGSIAVLPDNKEVAFTFDDLYQQLDFTVGYDESDITEETYNYIVAKLNQWVGV